VHACKYSFGLYLFIYIAIFGTWFTWDMVYLIPARQLNLSLSTQWLVSGIHKIQKWRTEDNDKMWMLSEKQILPFLSSDNFSQVVAH